MSTPPTIPGGAPLYTQGYGTVSSNALINIIKATRDPASNDIKGPQGNFSLGQRWLNTSALNVWTLASISSSNNVVSATWVEDSAGTGSLNSLLGDTGTALPSSGAITIAGGSGVVTSASGSTVTVSLTGGGVAIDSFQPDAGTNPVVPASTGLVVMAGTANQLTTTGGTNTLTFSVPATFIAPGSIASTTSITAANGFTVTTGTTSVTGTVGINTSGAGVTTIGTGGTGATNIGNATGNTAVTGSLTASTSLTATLGAITATNGNFVGTTAGTGLLLNPQSTSGTTTATLNGRVGSITITTPSIAAGATYAITITNSSITGSGTFVGYWLIGGTTGAALTIQSAANTASQSVVTIQNGTGATTNTDSLQLLFLVLN